MSTISWGAGGRLADSCDFIKNVRYHEKKKETALGLARMGAQVIMVCRDCTRGEVAQYEIRRISGNEHIDLFLADLSSQQEVRLSYNTVLQEQIST